MPSSIFEGNIRKYLLYKHEDDYEYNINTLKGMKRKICWITASYFLQVDLPVLSHLSKKYDIEWFIWGKVQPESAMTAKQYAQENDININFINSPYNSLDPRSFGFGKKLIADLRNKKCDLFYFDISTFPYLLWNIKKYLSQDRVIIAMHHGKIHSGMRLKMLYKPFLRYLNSQRFNLHYFSNGQAEAFNGEDSEKKFVIPLAINNFGSPSVKDNKTNKVVFTCFGNVIETKNIPLLIKAANKLWEKMPDRFIVRVIGQGKYWYSHCAPLIKHQAAFELDIRRVPDSEIPDIFASSTYMMFPYKAVTQSGPLRIAYGYNVPVIVSDLNGFKESVIDKITGLFFKSGDVESLVNVMQDVIEKHPLEYERLKESQMKYIRNNYGIDSICEKYKEMIDSCIKRAEKNEY